MAGLITPDKLAQIRSASDIVDIIGELHRAVSVP